MSNRFPVLSRFTSSTSRCYLLCLLSSAACSSWSFASMLVPIELDFILCILAYLFSCIVLCQGINSTKLRIIVSKASLILLYSYTSLMLRGFIDHGHNSVLLLEQGDSTQVSCTFWLVLNELLGSSKCQNRNVDDYRKQRLKCSRC